MSYLNVPRLNFSGNFQADPSTVNNNDSNFDPTVTLSNEAPDPTNPITNTSIYWNPNGTHNWKLQNCTVSGAANDQGSFSAPSADPIIGAQVLSAGRYPAKLVDLDPDNQAISQIWGLQVQVIIPNPADPTKPLASVTGTLPPTAFGDLWNRATNAPVTGIGMPTMSAVFRGVLQNVTWVNPNPAVSPLLTALQQISPNSLSIRLIVDSFQPDLNQANFTFGRIVGTIGPVVAGESPRSTPRRLASSGPFWTNPPLVAANITTTPGIFSAHGSAGAAWDAQRSVLILDLGNCVPTDGTTPVNGPSVPTAGWPIPPTNFQLTIPGPTVSPAPHAALKAGRKIALGCGAPSVLATIPFSLSTYLNYAGIVEISVPAALVSSLLNQPLTLTDVTNPAAPVTAAQEDAFGRYVDVDVPFFRLNPGQTGTVTLWATRYGQPWNGVGLDVALNPPINAANGPTTPPFPAVPVPLWQNGSPPSAVALSTGCVTTASNGTGVLTLTASDPGTPRTYPDGQAGPDGQVYWITGSWAGWGQIFLFPGAPINVLVFSGYPMPAAPTWTANVGPILSNYARMFPYMKTIIDLGDYPTVVQNSAAIQKVLNLPPENPHHMPIVRDLSAGKLAMINQWFTNGMPQ